MPLLWEPYRTTVLLAASSDAALAAWAAAVPAFVPALIQPCFEVSAIMYTNTRLRASAVSVFLSTNCDGGSPDFVTRCRNTLGQPSAS